MDMTYKDLQTIKKNTEKTRFRNEPVVLVPLKDWAKIEDLLENAEMEQSTAYTQSIKKSRDEIKTSYFYALDLKTGKFNKSGKSNR